MVDYGYNMKFILKNEYNDKIVTVDLYKINNVLQVNSELDAKGFGDKIISYIINEDITQAMSFKDTIHLLNNEYMKVILSRYNIDNVRDYIDSTRKLLNEIADQFFLYYDEEQDYLSYL